MGEDQGTLSGWLAREQGKLGIAVDVIDAVQASNRPRRTDETGSHRTRIGQVVIEPDPNRIDRADILAVQANDAMGLVND